AIEVQAVITAKLLKIVNLRMMFVFNATTTILPDFY
ncbi:MAG: hypothetical protein ACI936_003081, partial [Paraglaciecola sp.]